MKIQKLLVGLSLVCFSFIGCEEAPEKTNEKIDTGAEAAKDLIDLFSNQAKNIVSDKDLQAQLKEALGELKEEGAELSKILEEKGPGWQAKIEKLTNDPDFKDKLAALEKEGGDVVLNLEDLMEDKELEAKLKNILKEFEGEGKELQKFFEEKGPIWKEKLEDITNDPEFKDRVKKFGEDAEQILKKLETISE